jgi:8-oxo-dGTP pyrophosphatase MutT (NUDIX family)
MINTRLAIQEAIAAYQSSYGEEEKFKDSFLELLQHPRCFFRDHLPGHITGSAWIVDPSRQFVLLVHHVKLNRWLQPGGHADGDENVFGVALREAEEETGLKDLEVAHPGIFDLDVHTIPARKDFPEHLHFDVRFCFVAEKDSQLILSEESHDLQWIAISDMARYTEANSSILRMCQKTVSGFQSAEVRMQ